MTGLAERVLAICWFLSPGCEIGQTRRRFSLVLQYKANSQQHQAQAQRHQTGNTQSASKSFEQGGSAKKQWHDQQGKSQRCDVGTFFQQLVETAFLLFLGL
ncbi:MAG: hypothetical protein Q8M93_21935 [Polaromonas sp.]|uniref:hypothetical protein n=1 Tax=Polaromonas sp. TaxID=1869339 RepID=UPI00272FA95C|nr:hypothetical protein [Polaromonas sp.]MDP2452081.1 hypothetical protein [Polaromonas sp.]MDP3249612.1 hypothetical protein [Polaromonas sp.]